jgi:DNA-binding response OmpR family regulator/Tfp pilus assembly protein PilZ
MRSLSSKILEKNRRCPNYTDLIAIPRVVSYAGDVARRPGTPREHRIVARCEVELEGPLGRVIADSEDLSAAGLFVRTDELLRVGTQVVLKVTLPNAVVVQVHARVAHLIKPSVATALGRHQGMGFELLREDAEPTNAAALAAIRRYLSSQRADTSPAIELTTATRVVVAEPSAPLRARLARALERVGFRVDPHPDARSALLACEIERPDVVVTAENIDDLDGAGLVRQLAHHPNLVEVPVVMTGDDGSDLARLAAYRIGVREYIPKPFTDEELVIRVHRLTVPTTVEPTASLRGSLSDVGVTTLLSLFEFERKSGILMLMREGELARLLVGEGRVIKVESGEPNRSARDRLLDLLDWSSGEFEFASCTVGGDDEVRLATTPLLLEHARRRDEHDRNRE